MLNAGCSSAMPQSLDRGVQIANSENRTARKERAEDSSTLNCRSSPFQISSISLRYPAFAICNRIDGQVCGAQSRSRNPMAENDETNDQAGTAVADEQQAYQYNIRVEDVGPATKKVSVEIAQDRIQ